jgi:hypothetical protein
MPGEIVQPSARIFRLDLGVELATPQGDLSDRIDSAQGFRVGWFAANFSRYFAFGAFSRFFSTTSRDGDDLLFFDLIGYSFRVTVPVLMPELRVFGEADPALVGMHVPCGPDTFSCNEEGNEFVLRFGATGRGGVVYEVVESRLDVSGFISLEKTLPDDGGWFGVGVGMTLHYGPTHRELARRRAWMKQQQAQGAK